MSKAILILDKMPKSCKECRLCYNGIDCVINGWVVFADEGQTNRSSRCPLNHLRASDKKWIDEAEQYLIALKHCETCDFENTNDCKGCPYYRMGSSAKCYYAIDTAITIMRRYKKIVEILGEEK